MGAYDKVEDAVTHVKEQVNRHHARRAIARHRIKEAIQSIADKKKLKIELNPAKKDNLREKAGVKKDQKIPVAKLQEMKNSKNAETRKQANFALNFRK